MTITKTVTMNGQTDTRTAGKAERHSTVQWVPISRTKVSPTGQRILKPAFVKELAADFDIDRVGLPVLSLRDGWYWIIDGQHRIEAMREIGWADQLIECEVFENLSHAEEAAQFLRRQRRIHEMPIDHFKVSLTAGENPACDIDRIVRAQGLRVAVSKTEGSIGAVTTLTKLYKRGGPENLGKALRIVRDAYGSAGLSANVIEGIGLVCIRYGDKIDEKAAASKLAKTLGGVNGLINRANGIEKATGRKKGICHAAAAVDLLNSGTRNGRGSLSSWWRESDL